jgi:hypothetical protein
MDTRPTGAQHNTRTQPRFTYAHVFIVVEHTNPSPAVAWYTKHPRFVNKLPNMSSSASSSAGTASSNGQPIDPLTRNALRYSLSPREYKLLHKYLIARAPVVRKRAPQPHKYEKSVKDTNDYNAAAIRASLRVFGTTLAGLKLWDLITAKVLSKGKELP